MLLPDTDTDSAFLVAEKIRTTVSAIRVPGVERDITASAGVAGLLAHGGTAGGVGTWDSSAYTGMTGLIASGRNGGTLPLWDGSGIITSQSDATGGNLHSIAIARASDVRPATATATALWAGQTITGTDTLVMYTYGGDANLDGVVNIDDYGKLDTGFRQTRTGWINGDFNYDGVVNIDDYGIIDFNVTAQTGTFPAAGGIEGVAAVPEPAFVSFGGLGVLLARLRRGHGSRPRQKHRR